MRHTLVVVLPSAEEFTESFTTFDRLMNAIQQARRNARDFVTNPATALDSSDSWNVAVSCAHLHPAYDTEPSTVETAASGPPEVINVKELEYQNLRKLARRSPYPTVVVEVRAMPSPPELNALASTAAAAAPYGQAETTSLDAAADASTNRNAVTMADIQKLHSLFGKTAILQKTASKDSFWDAVGDAIPEVMAQTPVQLAQQWIANRQAAHAAAAAAIDGASPELAGEASFTTTETALVDEAFEFVFTNIAMLQDQVQASNVPVIRQQQYMILPRFLPTAATSFEKFGRELENLVSCLPSLRNVVSFTTYHPEHVDSSRRSPTPILALTWTAAATVMAESAKP
jgi:hypothetical protein